MDRFRTTFTLNNNTYPQRRRMCLQKKPLLLLCIAYRKTRINGDRYRAMITDFFVPKLIYHDVQELRSFNKTAQHVTKIVPQFIYSRKRLVTA